jgi:hypothetical protein
MGGCSADAILKAPPPVGQITIGQIKSQGDAEQFYAAAISMFESNFSDGYSGVVPQTERLSDEFHGEEDLPDNIDARQGEWTPNYYEGNADQAFGLLMSTRQRLLLSVALLQEWEPASGQAKIGEAYARLGYTEILLAEAYCSGVTLDYVSYGGGITYEHPVTADSVFGVAVAHFDSALVYANGDAFVQGLANNGKARALLGRGKFADAQAAAHLVPTSFTATVGTLYRSPIGFSYDVCQGNIISDGEGGVGINFASANDPRLIVKDTLCSTSYEAHPWHTKYTDQHGYPPPLLTYASGIEARLIEAEAKATAGDNSWIDDINALRTTCTNASACPTNAPAGTGGIAGLPPLTAPSNADSAVAMVMRERAFWLFSQGTRLGDMRRLIKYHNRPMNTVYPTGAYPYQNSYNGLTPIATYGSDISLTLPTQAVIQAGQVTITNPYYKGCLGSTASD